MLFVLFALAKSFRKKKNKKVWNCSDDLIYITTFDLRTLLYGYNPWKYLKFFKPKFDYHLRTAVFAWTEQLFNPYTVREPNKLCFSAMLLKKLIFLRQLTLSWRRPLSYWNQFIDLRSKSMDWFPYMITASVMKELKINNFLHGSSYIITLITHYLAPPFPW